MLTHNAITKQAKASYQGYDLFSGNLDELLFANKTVISTLNQYSFCMAEKDLKFKQAYSNRMFYCRMALAL